jgi:IS5 family transposase
MWRSMWSRRGASAESGKLARMRVPRRLRAHVEVVAAAPVDGASATAELLEAIVRGLRGDAA